ncbi:telomere-associated protein RIF1 isoform 1 [Camelus ferus]|nr:telomere-associated protein RIF1 isoform 1 [Camelus ferus]
MTGEDGKEIIAEIEKKLSRLFKALKVSNIIDSLEIVFNRGETHSAVVDYEALNVIIRLIEQAPVQMGEESIRWAKLVIPLVVHSAQKVHLRGATALEMGMPLLLQKQQEIASITEQLMTTVCVPLIQSTISIDSSPLPQGNSPRVATSPGLNPMSPIHKGNKKERPGSEVLTLLLKSLESVVKSEVFPVSKTLTNEVNQGDALEHNFSAIYGALTLPVNHIFSAQKFPAATMKTLLKTWSELYRTFARCAALVATAEENLCCEELSSKIMSSLEEEGFSHPLGVVFFGRCELVQLDEVPKVYSCMNNKLEKLLGEIISYLHFSCTGAYDSELLEQISPLLCVIFSHKNKQIRKQSAQFWNATFAKVTMLNYPEELKEIPTLTEKSKEDSKMVLKEEQKESDSVMPQLVMENCGMDEHLEKASFSSNECGSIEKTNPEILSSNNDARKKALIASKKTPTECAPSTENTYGVSSSSNATIPGAPPQPTSRRQSFITLEKFDGSENRPFSPSPLNNMASTVTVKNNQEGTTKTDNPPKAKKRETALSKSDSEKIVHGSKRSGRRSSKAEQIGNKKSKPLMKSDQAKSTQESADGMVALENNPPDLLNQTECVLDNQVHLSESTVECEDIMLKPTVENAVLLENNTVEEKALEINLESKENTPPAIITADQTVNEDSHIQITSNQKTLRRSLRRRSETTEPTTDSQDKENNHQKRERRKEEEKTLQKSPLQVKDDLLPKQKLISEQTVQENLIEKGNNLHEKTFGETSTNSETDENRRKPDLENTKSEGDGAQDIADKSSEKSVRGRTRYQTRRASQGLLSSIENSESDSSEAKEESSKKKRSGKWKNRSNDSVDIEDPEEKMVKQECIKVEHETHDYKVNFEVDTDIKSQICEKDENNTVILQDSTASSDLLQVSDDVADTYEGKSKTSRYSESPFLNLPVPESNLRTRNANKRLHKRDSVENSVGESSKVGTADISLLSEKTLQTLECQHKRSRRVRRSKGCDCCGEKSQPQEKSVGLKDTENYDVKVSETKKTDVRTPVTISETSKADLHSEVKLLDEHHTVNFHLDLKEENDTTNDSPIVSETELKENTIQDSLPSGMVNFKETCDRNSKEPTSLESQEPSSKKCKTSGLCLDDTKDTSLECFTLETKEEKPEAVSKKESSIENIVNVEANACEVKAEMNPEEVDAMELDVESDKSEVSVSEQKSVKTGISEKELTEENSERRDESEADAAEEAVTEDSGIGHSDNSTPVKLSAQIEISEQTAVGELDRGGNESNPDSSEEMNAEMGSCAETVIGEVTAETDHVSEAEDEDLTIKASEPVEAEMKRLYVEINNFVPDTLETSTKEGNVNSNKTETNTECNEFEETKLDDNQMVAGNDGVLQDHHTSEKVEETAQPLTSGTAVSELISEDSNTSPQKLGDLDPLLASANDSPSGMQGRCVWSPLASPSTSILKRGLKRSQEDEISSPVHKVRRVSFADPIYQAGLADDIDRRCSTVRCHSSNSSPMVKSVKTSPTAQYKGERTGTTHQSQEYKNNW